MLTLRISIIGEGLNMDLTREASDLLSGKTVLGIELGSTRIKSVIIGRDHKPVSEGAYNWENQLADGIWTYSLDEVKKGLESSYSDLINKTEEKTGIRPTSFAAMGVSGMMHGYLAFNDRNELLVPFRTWRNIMTEQAARDLTELFGYNIPQRYSISHLYQAILNKESHVSEIAYLTTLAGYVHWKLTGRKVLGIGDASGMFPIDPMMKTYRKDFIEKFERIPAINKMPWKLTDILPHILLAGDSAGRLTADGAAFLDPTGELQPGVPLCPPEGDAETGMVATDAVSPRTGNISAGTSDFAILVLENPLHAVYQEIDIVASPSGELAANVHCNNCTSDLNAWVNLFGEAISLLGYKADHNTLFNRFFEAALQGEADAGNIISYNYLAGEITTHVDEGCPLLMRSPESRFNLVNFMRSQLYACIATLRIGMDILFQNENLKFDRIMGHGGFFKTPGVGQQILADGIGLPITLTETAAQGGAWGIALLAQYMLVSQGEPLGKWLDEEVFRGCRSIVVKPDERGQTGFNSFLERYKKGLPAEYAAGSVFSKGGK